MPEIRLPDGSKRQFESDITVAEIAQNIGAGLARAALAGRVNDQLVDLSFLIREDSDVAIITDKNPEGLEVIRHSTAHLLAYAVKELFPDAQVTIGPVIEHGFYYDFSYTRPFTPEDLEKIEKKMVEILARNDDVIREDWPIAKAVETFEKMGERFKAEIIRDLAAKGGTVLFIGTKKQAQDPVRSYAEALKSDTQRFAKFFWALLDRGVYFAPSQFEAGFLSTAHGPAELDRTLDAARATMQSL